MHTHTRLMVVALSHLGRWLATIDQEDLMLCAHPADGSRMQKVVGLADDAYYGVAVNGDGQTDPVMGEAGTIIAFQQG